MSYVDVIKHAPWVNYGKMMFLVFALIFSLFFFVNSLYYSLSLLALVILIMVYLSSQQLLSTLSVLILCIVYIGAMIILIGYICAICPNVKVSSSSSFSLVFLSFPLFLFYEQKTFSFKVSTQSSLVDFFYSDFGLFLFLSLVFMLFITLLIVTSQYLTPKGPFRSVSR